MSRRKTLAAAASLLGGLAALTAAGGVYAHHIDAQSAGDIHACVTDRTGDVRITAHPALRDGGRRRRPFGKWATECSKGEHSLDWAFASVSFVDAQVPASRDGLKTKYVPCPPGQQAIGGGHRIDGLPNVAVVASHPHSNNEGWLVTARHIYTRDVPDGPWSLSVWAICI